MRRLSLSTKLIAAAVPLVVAVVGLLALTVRSDLATIDRAESGAELGGIWQPLITTLTAVEDEAANAAAVEADETGGTSADLSARRETDQAINELRTAIEQLGAFEAASDHVTSSRSALSAARRNIDMATIAPSMVGDVEPAEAYRTASRELVAVGQLLPAEAGDAELGRELLAVVKLAEAKLHANDVVNGTSQWPNELRNIAPLLQARDAFADLQTTIGEFEAIAPEEWATEFRQDGFNTELGAYATSLNSVVRAADGERIETFDTAGFSDFIEEGVAFQREVSQSIVETSNQQAAETRSATLVRIGIILGAVLAGVVIAWFITRSITRRVKAVANTANQVTAEQLPALVEAMRDPRGKAVLPEIEPVDAKGGDDLAELATAFNAMQATLVDVAHEQVEVLRRGVSDIFITMARRNRSLIDRQLAMLDEFEASVDDHEVLSNYYQLDHLATRMRRNSESLLVLANAEPKRRRVKATEIDDVVRASIGEVEDYRRIEIQHLESLQVKGTVVADISHLLAELLDNATSFSPPGSVVRVGGRRTDDSYMIRIVDDGVGVPPERLAELNELLREPPVVGLSVESTLGMSVVSLLANKHGVGVTLSAGSPGLTVDVVVPSSVFGPMDAPDEQVAPGAAAAPSAIAPVADAPAVDHLSTEPDAEQIVTWEDETSDDETFEPAEPAAPPVPAPAAAPQPAGTEDDESSDWGISLALSAFDTPRAADDVPTGEPTAASGAAAPDVPAEPEFEPTFDAASADDDEFAESEVAGQISSETNAELTVGEPAMLAEPVTTPDPATASTATGPAPDTDEVAVEAIAQLPVVEPTTPAEPVTTPGPAAASTATGPTPDTDEVAVDEVAPQPADPFTSTEPAPASPAEPVTDPVSAQVDEPATDPTVPAADHVDEDAMEPAAPSIDSPPAAAAIPSPPPAPAAVEPTLTEESVDQPAVPTPAPAPAPVTDGAPSLPPPTARPRHGEFDRPPAPPITATGLSRRPVAPADARPAPNPTPPPPSAPALPTRSQRGTGPEGPDRLADRGEQEPAVGTSEPGALQAALAAFDLGRSSASATQPEALPTRDRVQGAAAAPDDEMPVTQSRVDPDALRDRLRAFTSEFSNANSGESNNDTPDLGGDPR